MRRNMMLLAVGILFSGNICRSGGSLQTSNVNHKRYADEFEGADAGAKILAAVNDLPATGGIVDATGLEGPQRITSDIFNGTHKQIHVYLGAATFVIDVDVTIPDGVTITFGQGTLLVASEGKTITYDGIIDAPLEQIFDGSVRITSLRTVMIYPQWFGAKGDGVSDDTVAWQNTLRATSGSSFVTGGNDGNTVVCAAATYRVTSTLLLPRSLHLMGPTRRGVGDPPFALGCTFNAEFAGPLFVARANVRTPYDLLLSNFSIRGAKDRYGEGDGIQLLNIADATLESIVIGNFGRYNINVGSGSDNIHIRDVYSAQAGLANFYIDSSNSTCFRCTADTAKGATNLIATTNASDLSISDGHFESNDGSAIGLDVRGPRVRIVSNLINMTQGGRAVVVNTTNRFPILLIDGNTIAGSGLSPGTIGIDIQSGLQQRVANNVVLGFLTALKVRGDGAIITGNFLEGSETGLDLAGASGIPHIVNGNFISGPQNSILHTTGDRAIYYGNRTDDGTGVYKPPTITAGKPLIVQPEAQAGENSISYLIGSAKYIMGATRFEYQQSMAKVFTSSSQVIRTGIPTAVSFDRIAYNTDNLYEVTNPTRLTAQISGKYLACGSLDFASHSEGARALHIRTNGMDVDDTQMAPLTNGDDTIVKSCTSLVLNAGDYVEVFAVQSSGVGLIIRNNPRGTWFSLQYQGQ